MIYPGRWQHVNISRKIEKFLHRDALRPPARVNDINFTACELLQLKRGESDA